MDKSDEYLTTKELGLRIKYATQTIYNMISKGVFIEGQHYIKPSKGKLLFIWSAINAWLEGESKPEPVFAEAQKHQGSSMSLGLARKCLIRL